ncbi:MAG: serine hydrolase domain-containing protein, partial [Bacteroidales bacterium]
SGLLVLFFFGEIAISFSDRVEKNSFTENENLSFALKLDNDDTDFVQEEYIDRLFESFLDRYSIKGASVAVTEGEKLVYAKGFGLANTENSEQVQPGHLFRIASVSKLITAVAIMKLSEENKLDLDQLVFGEKGILNDEIFSEYKDKRIEKIRIRHLLNHTPGWSRHKGDPVFNSLYIAKKMGFNPPADEDLVIQYALDQYLSYEPGTRYSYSNLGYVILGKIISRISGMPYEDYVVINVLKPMGIHDMHIGKSLYHEKFPNEVHYYEPAGSSMCLAFDGSGRMVPKSYGGNNIELLGAAGGWVASGPELAKFVSAIDGFELVPDFLTDSTIKVMTDPDLSGKGLFGWRGADRHGTWWRTGTLSGSMAFTIRMENGLNWVVLLNTSGYKRQRLHNKLSRTIFAASYRVKEWPHYDLFTARQNVHPTSISEIPINNPEL